MNPDRLYAGAVLLCLALAAEAQISKPTEEDISAAAPHFQKMIREKLSQKEALAKIRAETPSNGMAAAGTPATSARKQSHPSADPRDISGNWSENLMGGNGELIGVTERPGRRYSSPFEATRLCMGESVLSPKNADIYLLDNQINIVTGNNVRTRRIYLNDKLPTDFKPQYGGHSVGRWEGDTLVIETVGLKGSMAQFRDDKTAQFTRMLMTTPTLTVTERLRKIENNTQLEHLLAFADPQNNMPPYSMRIVYNYGANMMMGSEDICEAVGDLFGPQYGKD